MFWPLVGLVATAADQRISRTRLAGELWPDNDEASARHCLASALWRIRSALPSGAMLLTASGDWIALARGHRLWVDTVAFDIRLKRALAAPERLAHGAERHRLAQALGLYRNAFLRECDHPWAGLQRERLLVNEARQAMPGAQTGKRKYSTRLFWIGELKAGFADADVIIEWEGNDYGEIGSAVIRKDIKKSSDWSRSSCNLTIRRVERIPAPGTDPREWPISYTYDGTFDPMGNGLYEFSGEFEINAFGGLHFVRHDLVSHSFSDFLKIGSPEDYVKRGANIVVATPKIPDEQVTYLRSKLP